MVVSIRTKLQFSIPFVLLSILFSHLSISQTTKDSSYYPLALGNQWIYRSANQSSTDTETIVDTQRVNGKLYFGLAINSSIPIFWLRKDSNKVYLAPTLTIPPDTADIIENMMYDFSADVHKEWSVHLNFNGLSLLSCDYNGDIELYKKTDSVTTSSGIFTNCFCFIHRPPCADAGRYAEWFAPGVGKVLFYQDYIWGADGFSLTNVNLIT